MLQKILLITSIFFYFAICAMEDYEDLAKIDDMIINQYNIEKINRPLPDVVTAEGIKALIDLPKYKDITPHIAHFLMEGSQLKDYFINFYEPYKSCLKTLYAIEVDRGSCLSPNGTRVAVKDDNKCLITIYNIKPFKFINSFSTVSSIDWIDDQRMFFYNEFLQIWNIDTNSVEYTFTDKLISASPDNKIFLLLSGSLIHVDNTNQLISCVTFPPNVLNCYWNSTGTLLAIKIDATHVDIFETVHGKLINHIVLSSSLGSPPREIFYHTIVLTDKYLITLQSRRLFTSLNNLNVYELTTGNIISSTCMDYCTIHQCIGNNSILILLKWRTCKVWHIEEKKVVLKIREMAGFLRENYQEDSTLIFRWVNNLLLLTRKDLPTVASGYDESKCWLYSFTPKIRYMVELRGLNNKVFDCKLSNDGKTLATLIDNKIQLFSCDSQEMKDLFGTKLTLTYALFLLIMEKNYQNHTLTQLDSVTEKIVTSLKPSIRKQFEPFLIENESTILSMLIKIGKYMNVAIEKYKSLLG